MTDSLTLHHGTQEKEAKRILASTFKSSYGRFGTGVYFSNDKNYCKSFGNTLLEVTIPTNKIKTIQYIKLKDMYPYLNISEEEGCPELEKYCKENKYKAVKIVYIDKSFEVCVYDTAILKNIRIV